MSTPLTAIAIHLFDGSDTGSNARGGRTVGGTRQSAASPEHGRNSPAISDVLVERIRMGDEQAFGSLMTAHYNAMARFAASLLSSGDSADDIVQGVFVRVWAGRERLDPRRAMRTYLFTAVRNRVLDRHKHLVAQQTLISQVQADAAAAEPSPEQLLELREQGIYEEQRVRALAHALAGLPERQRSALVLRFDQGMTHAEIGAVLGCSAKAAQQIVLRTIAGLRELLRS